MNTNKKAPKLRFKGFTDDWEQRKLGNLATVEMNKRIFKEQTTTKGDIPFYKIGTFGSDADSFISRELFEEYKNKYPYPNIGDILISASGSIGRTVVYNGEDAYYQDSNIVWLNHNGQIDNSFLLQFYNQVKWAGLEGSTIKRLYNKNILETNIALPKIEEQRLIGKFFKLVDSSITLYQRKLDKMKLNKRVLLQKLFPQNGCTIPEVRFKGFTDAWEQRKLSDISTKVTTKNVDVHYTETLTNSAEQGIISQVDFFDKEISNKNNINGYYIVENNDFIYNPRISTLAPVGPINRNKLNRTGIMSPLYTVFRASNVDLGFLEWYFQSNHWHRYMKLNGDSGARADRIAIKDSTFFEMPIKTPVNIKEQVLIGETLEKFNQYITLHQCKLDRLISIKKALLQQLFV